MMTPKRELARKLNAAEELLRQARASLDEANTANARYRDALSRVAKLHGFYTAYIVEKRPFWPSPALHAPENLPSVVLHEFSADALIADLDTIDKATSADEARKRLGIKEEA